MAIRPTGLNVGITGLGYVRETDDVHLPVGRSGALLFLPEPRALDEILRPETLDESLTRMLAPDGVDPDLMSPPIMAATRENLAAKVAEAMGASAGEAQSALSTAASVLKTEIDLDREIQDALAELLRA